MHTFPLVPIASLDELAAKIGLPKFMLTRYIFQADSFYKTFKRAKKSGHGFRQISAPSRELKGIQKWIAVFILRSVPLTDQATAFRPRVSTAQNARAHIRKDFVCNIDLEDFFPSIAAKRVTAIFKSFGYPPDVAGSLSRLCTYRGVLPQGAPSSPDLSNIVLRNLDRRVQGFCSRRGWSYTRYCDDLTVSGPGGITVRELSKIRQIIEEEGFRINERKLKVARRNQRQKVTGLTVNERLNLPRNVQKTLRVMFHQAALYPAIYQARVFELEGRLNYFAQICPHKVSQIARYREVIAKLKGISTTSIPAVTV